MKKSEASISPLRYPGGKSLAVKMILPYFPKTESRVISPFLGGGSIETALGELGYSVYATDNYYDLITFWHMALREPEGLANRVETLLRPKLQQMGTSFFRRLQEGLRQIDSPMDRAACFFALNRASFSGSTQAGGMSSSLSRLTQSSIERLRRFSGPNLSVDCQDYRFVIPSNREAFLFLDPPYALPKGRNNLYGVRGRTHRSFDHLSLYHLLRARPRGRFILCYNDTEFIRELYGDYEQIELEWAYGMNNSKKSSELLILG